MLQRTFLHTVVYKNIPFLLYTLLEGNSCRTVVRLKSPPFAYIDNKNNNNNILKSQIQGED